MPGRGSLGTNPDNDNASLAEQVDRLERLICVLIGSLGVGLVALGQVLPMWHTAELKGDDPPAHPVLIGFWGLGVAGEESGAWLAMWLLINGEFEGPESTLGWGPLAMLAGACLAPVVTHPRFTPLWLDRGDQVGASAFTRD